MSDITNHRADSALHSADLPHIDNAQLHPVDVQRLLPVQRATHAPRILLLYGSVRERSYSRLLTEEAARLLQALGAEARIFDPRPAAAGLGAR